MQRLSNAALGIVISSFTIILVIGIFYNFQLSPVNQKKDIIEVEIPEKTSVKGIASILRKKKLIRDERIFLIYVKMTDIRDMKAGYYDLSPNMGTKKIISILREGSKKNPNEIKITFKEGITMRDIAQVISAQTDNSFDDVINKSNDVDYLDTLIQKYWFITEDIKQEEIYYKLEGYLFPDTYHFNNKQVNVEEIFNRMIKEMDNVLTPYRADIEKNSLSIHQLLTLTSMVEKEAANRQSEREEELKTRATVASVFLNRMQKNMSLGSDVTTRYACKIDNPKQPLTKAQYYTKNPYNTRITDGSMNGKLPIGPISTISKISLQASLYPENTDYLYFIANIQTLETFFYQNSSDFEKKKIELASVNGGF